jgi:pimeloyl-ACP methyl ester carboxylesterase
VHGGADGTEAHLDDLITASRLFAAAASEIEDVIGACFVLSGGLSDEAIVGRDAVRAAIAPLDELHTRLRWFGRLLMSAVADYLAADAGVLGHLESMASTVIGQNGKLPIALVTGTRVLITDGPSAAFQAVLTDDPELLDEASLLARVGVPGPDRVAAHWLTDRYFVDGRPHVSARGLDTRSEAMRAPRCLADLMDGLQLRNSGAAGEVDVKLLTGADGRRRVIVDIPGTKDWSLGRHTPNVTGLATNVRAIEGAATTYEHGVLDAMARAGVRSSDEVMVVGHSLGGMVAVALARDATRAHRFHVTHVVTAGAPVAAFVGQVPKSVQVLALENKHDVVPRLDGAANPDRINVTTVTTNRDDGSVSGDHGIDTAYRPGAADADASDDPAIRAFVRSADGYFNAASAQTHTFVITRR